MDFLVLCKHSIQRGRQMGVADRVYYIYSYICSIYVVDDAYFCRCCLFHRQHLLIHANTVGNSTLHDILPQPIFSRTLGTHTHTTDFQDDLGYLYILASENATLQTASWRKKHSHRVVGNGMDVHLIQQSTYNTWYYVLTYVPVSVVSRAYAPVHRDTSRSSKDTRENSSLGTIWGKGGGRWRSNVNITIMLPTSHIGGRRCNRCSTSSWVCL